MGSMTRDLSHLLADYAKEEPRRAFGGLYALAGFDYQIRVYVAHLAKALARGGDDRDGAGAVFIEALSDLAEGDSGGLVCIQVKRTLTAATLKSAAQEALAIDRFLADRDPAARDQVRFSVVASRGDPALGWDDLPATEAAALAPLFEAGRLLPPRLEPDPAWRAVIAVWDRLDDPYGFVRFALDQALGRGLDPAGAERVRDAICERYARERRTAPSVGRLLVPEDFVQTPDPSPRLDIGREATLPRLRDAQYMPRPGRRDALCARLDERLDLSRRDRQAAARVLWISGRSGVGKSVLLLQMLERLVDQGRRVLWLGGAAERLDPVLRALADQPEDLRPEVVAVDDLYDRDARTRLDLAGLGDFIDQAGPRPWPLILTCGPVEFAEDFEAATRFRGFEVHRETVHPVARGEALGLADWYRGRTGREPAAGTAFAQSEEGEGLLVSLAVELEHGDLREFARRFAERVEINGLGQALLLPLALNRLYLRAPYAWLADPDRERLATLNREGDFRVLDPGEADRVVRLTHPHLADALYRALRRPGNPLAYANDLAQAFERALGECNLSLVDQLLAVLSAPRTGLTGERLAAVDDGEVAARCATAWAAAIPDLALDPETDALIAAAWACWELGQPKVAEILGRDLLDRAIAALDTAVKTWPLAWQRAWTCRPGHPSLLDWAEARLPDEGRRSHPAWSFVWELCQDADPSRPAWRAMALTWLAGAGHRPDWHFVWRHLLPEGPLAAWTDPVLALGERHLGRGGDGADWAYVLEDLLALTPGLPGPARALVARGWAWLPGRAERAEWSYVWQALLAQAGHLPDGVTLADLLGLGWAWLPGREERAEWAHVWQALLAQAGHLPGGVTLGRPAGAGLGLAPGARGAGGVEVCLAGPAGPARAPAGRGDPGRPAGARLRLAPGARGAGGVEPCLGGADRPGGPPARRGDPDRPGPARLGLAPGARGAGGVELCLAGPAGPGRAPAGRRDPGRPAGARLGLAPGAQGAGGVELYLAGPAGAGGAPAGEGDPDRPAGAGLGLAPGARGAGGMEPRLGGSACAQGAPARRGIAGPDRCRGLGVDRESRGAQGLDLRLGGPEAPR